MPLGLDGHGGFPQPQSRRRLQRSAFGETSEGPFGRPVNHSQIVIAGAGTIGCYLGGLLQAAGSSVTFWGRPRMQTELAQVGLTLTDRDGGKIQLAPGSVRCVCEPAAVGEADVILVTVKSGATQEIANSIAEHARPGVWVVSFQNGVGNVAILKSVLSHQRVVAGMVPFNVVHLGPGAFHRATAGELAIDESAPEVAALLRTAGLVVNEDPDMQAVAWGKLLINLNNALNALSGLPLAEQLADHRWRVILADCVAEALKVLDQSGIRAGRVGPVAPKLLPVLMRLPNWLFRRVARRQLQIDPLARSSMWEDIERGRVTEIDYLQGAVVEAARKVGLAAPMNARVQELVHRAEADKKGSPRLDPSVLSVSARNP
jgi:2-dehydropantoate 2-reductase